MNYFKLFKPLYGLTESADYWCETFARYHLHNLRMQQPIGDFALFFRRELDNLIALSGSYVDDILQAGSPDMRQKIQRTIKDKFQITCNDLSNFIYTGILCDVANRNISRLSQAHYIKILSKLASNATWGQYRSLRAKLVWVFHALPDIACSTSMATQVTVSIFNPTSVQDLNRIVKYFKSSVDASLWFPKLGQRTLRMVVYFDASFNNIPGNRSQFGFLIFLADHTNRYSILHFSSYKSSRVTRSSTAGETVAFSDAFDNAFIILHDLEHMLGCTIPILMQTDSEKLFNVLTRAKYTTERRLMVDISAARGAHSDRLISNIGLIASAVNPADGLTKINGNGALQHLMHTHRLEHEVLQFFIRPPAQPDTQ